MPTDVRIWSRRIPAAPARGWRTLKPMLPGFPGRQHVDRLGAADSAGGFPTMATSTPTTTSLTRRPAWSALQEHHRQLRDVHLRTLFAEDPARGERLTLDALGLYFDYSKHRITDETLRLLVRLAEESGLRERIDAMFGGQKINSTEGRAVLHTALRVPRDASIVVDGENVVPAVHAVLDRMADFAERVR